jgi:ABC-type multidrug transport system ATPase subunit/ABC-type multidrug transport system permease subunit
MLNDTIISGLVNLFALVGARNGVDEQRSVKFLRNYLSRQAGIRGTEEFVSLYLDLRGVYSLDDSLDKTGIVAGICDNIRSQLPAGELSLLLLRLMEFARVDDRDIFPQMAADFGIPETTLQDFRDFVDGTVTERVLLQHFPGYEGAVKTLWIAERGTLVFSYMGRDEVLFNDVPLLGDSFQVWAKSGVMKSHHGIPLHFSTVYKPYEDVSATRVVFSGRNLEYRYPGSDNGLHNMTFSVRGGELVAIMGGSGVGKSTLLSILDGSVRPDSGSLDINGWPLDSPEAKSLLGFVPQDDLLLEDLTVYENLYFTAKFCFDGLSEEELREKVMAVLHNLELDFARDLKVGSPLNKTISGGQRKRLNIALELIRQPSVLLLDEPTSGLSSADSERVMGLLRAQADAGCLVIANIHQPSSDIYKMFDRLWVLDAGGYPVYDGNPIDAITRFKQAANYADPETSTCPLCGNVNPEIVLNIIDEKTVDATGRVGSSRKVTPQQWHEMYLDAVEDIPSASEKAPLPESDRKKPGAFRQFCIYLRRNIKSKLTNIQYVAITLLEAPVLALICAWLTRYAPPSGYTLMDNKNLVQYIFMAVIVAVFLGMSTSAEEIIRDRTFLKREKFLSLSYHSYIWSKIAYTAMISFVQTVLFILVGNAVIGLHGLFFVWWAVLFAIALVSNLIGLLLSQNLGSVVAIYISIPLLLVPQILLCGLVVDFSDLDSGSKTGNVPVIGDVIPSRWAFEALAVGTFQYNRYERAWFDLDRERYEALYWKDIVLEDFKDGADPALVERTLPHICEVAGVPFEGSSAEMIEAAGAAFASVCNDATLEKDRLVREAVAERGMEGMVERKRNNYNIRLEELLTGVSEPAPYVVAGGCLVPKTGAVFLTPASKNGRAPFYSSVKILGGARVPTLLYNLCILLLMGMVLTIILLINIKSIKFKIK